MIVKMYSKTYIFQSKKTLQKLSIWQFEDVASQLAQRRLTHQGLCGGARENQPEQGE